MADSILEKYTGRGTQGGASGSGADTEVVEDCGEAFGWLRGIGDKAVMLELRKKTGIILAVGYGWIEKVEFSPEGIKFQHCGQKFHIKGRNLNLEIRPSVRLFQGIVRHRVPWIQEADQAAIMKAPKDGVLIQEIVW